MTTPPPRLLSLRHAFFRFRVAIEAWLWTWTIVPVMSVIGMFRPCAVAMIRGERFGPFISEPDKLLRLSRDDPDHQPKILFGIVGPVSNRAVLELLRSELPIIESPLLYHSLMRALNASPRVGSAL